MSLFEVRRVGGLSILPPDSGQKGRKCALEMTWFLSVFPQRDIWWVSEDWSCFFFFLKLSWPRNSNVKQLTLLFIAWKHENTQIIKRLNMVNWMPALFSFSPTEPSKIGKPQVLSLCFDFLCLCAILLSLIGCWTPVCAITPTFIGIPEFPSWS